MKNIEKNIVEKISNLDSINLGYVRYVGDRLEIGLTSYIDIDFVGDVYILLKQLLYPYKNQSVKITIVDVNDGDKNPLDAVISIKV